MSDPANGVEGQETRYKAEHVLAIALELHARKPSLDWVAFFRQIFGLNGVIREVFETPEEIKRFEKSYAYARIQQILNELRERTVPREDDKEPTRVITVRVPKSLHEALRAEAHVHQTSMNKLCISKLLQPVDSDSVPRERWKRVAQEPETDSMEEAPDGALSPLSGRPSWEEKGGAEVDL